MSNPDDANHGGILEDYLERVRVDVIQTRSRYRAEAPNAPPALEQRLRDLTIEYYELLREYRDENAVKEIWESTDADTIDDLLTQTTRIEQPTPGRGTSSQTTHAPLIRQTDGHRLAELTEDLDKIANAMNISVSVPDRTPNDRVDTDDLRELLKGRGQHEAAERVPKRGSET